MKKMIYLIFCWLIYFSGVPLSKVYVCRSPTAHVYHSGYCQGLNNCTHKVDQVTVDEAVKLGYNRPCGHCYK
jgi:hypothetical protein